MSRQNTINDTDREDFVRNDEGLYNMWRSEMRGEKKIREFVRANRDTIDSAIQKSMQPKSDGHYYMIGRGAYGPGTSPGPVGRAGQSLMPR